MNIIELYNVIQKCKFVEEPFLLCFAFLCVCIGYFLPSIFILLYLSYEPYSSPLIIQTSKCSVFFV